MTGVDPGYPERRPPEASEGIYPGRGRERTRGTTADSLLCFCEGLINIGFWRR